MRLLDRFRRDSGEAEAAIPDCGCDPAVRSPSGYEPNRGGTLVVDADDCPEDGDLVASPDCRATVIDALVDRDVEAVHVTERGRERIYDDDAVGLLIAAGRFATRVTVHDESLAERARFDPLAAARDATGRAGPISDLAATTGLAAGASRADDYEAAIRSTVGPAVSNARVDPRPPTESTLCGRRDLDTGATVRCYRTPAGRRYLLEPLESRLDAPSLAALDDAHDRLAAGSADGPGAVARAVRAAAAAADGAVSTAAIQRVLRKHTAGHGVLEDLFADPRVSEVVVTAPVVDNPVRVAVDGDRVPTNVRLTRTGVAALASRFRRESGRAFARGDPTLDATTDTRCGRVRVAGITNPASDGIGFAFRTDDRERWTVPALVANGTLPADAAALCSVAAERAAAGLIAGPRGAGKTTLLGALLWELPRSVRSVVVEDTPELPVDALRTAGRDVQSIRFESDDGPSLSATEALRAALRLGEGALIVGEVRGDEAAALYEAMRVGAASSAVLGTIHGDGPDSVLERVVTDLGVPASSFAATDFLVTLTAGNRRRVATITEVRHTDDGVAFESLFEPGEGDGSADAEATGVVDRGNSQLVAALARPDETYRDVLDLIDERTSLFEELVATERTDPESMSTARGWT
jgi:type IV secretory pathway ATPase VirB11/archaellum biosynthesis ATPase